MRALVTGGAGYIGSHTAKALAQAGFEPVVFDNLSTGHRWAVKWGPLVEADLADKTAIEEALRAYRVEAVIHFAANAYVSDYMGEPGSASSATVQRRCRAGAASSLSYRYK